MAIRRYNLCTNSIISLRRHKPNIGVLKMKITKRQLKRIIREEKSRILTEDYGMHEEDVILEVLQDYITQGLQYLGTSDNIWLEGSEIQYYVKMAANHMGTGGVTYHRERGPAKPKYDASIAHLAPEEK